MSCLTVFQLDCNFHSRPTLKSPCIEFIAANFRMGKSVWAAPSHQYPSRARRNAWRQGREDENQSVAASERFADLLVPLLRCNDVRSANPAILRAAYKHVISMG
jgi:hypothetical protein